MKDPDLVGLMIGGPKDGMQLAFKATRELSASDWEELSFIECEGEIYKIEDKNKEKHTATFVWKHAKK